MLSFFKKRETPFRGEIEEAKKNPNGWVYRIKGNFRPNEAIPKEAIVGAWKVDADGKIVGEVDDVVLPYVTAEVPLQKRIFDDPIILIRVWVDSSRSVDRIEAIIFHRSF